MLCFFLAGAFSSTARQACQFTRLALPSRRRKTNGSITAAVQSLSQVVLFICSLLSPLWNFFAFFFIRVLIYATYVPVTSKWTVMNVMKRISMSVCMYQWVSGCRRRLSFDTQLCSNFNNNNNKKSPIVSPSPLFSSPHPLAHAVNIIVDFCCIGTMFFFSSVLYTMSGSVPTTSNQSAHDVPSEANRSDPRYLDPSISILPFPSSWSKCVCVSACVCVCVCCWTKTVVSDSLVSNLFSKIGIFRNFSPFVFESFIICCISDVLAPLLKTAEN